MKSRNQLPLIILDLDGVIGYWDENKIYHMRSSTLNYLIGLSINFRIVGIAQG